MRPVDLRLSLFGCATDERLTPKRGLIFVKEFLHTSVHRHMGGGITYETLPGHSRTPSQAPTGPGGSSGELPALTSAD